MGRSVLSFLTFFALHMSAFLLFTNVESFSWSFKRLITAGRQRVVGRWLKAKENQRRVNKWFLQLVLLWHSCFISTGRKWARWQKGKKGIWSTFCWVLSLDKEIIFVHPVLSSSLIYSFLQPCVIYTIINNISLIYVWPLLVLKLGFGAHTSSYRQKHLYILLTHTYLNYTIHIYIYDDWRKFLNQRVSKDSMSHILSVM